MASSAENYINRLNKRLRGGDATELTYRSDLEKLLIEVGSGTIEATSEPKRRIDCGAPDISVKRSNRVAGFIETKVIDTDLDKEEAGEQLTRYRRGLGNLILTDYLEFRWYLDGEHQLTAYLGIFDSQKNRVRAVEDPEPFITLLSMFLDAEDKAETIANARDLARRMAERTRLIRRTIFAALNQENEEAKEKGRPPNEFSLHAQLQGFREILLHDFSEDDFADMYAQTISYGLFTARFNKKPKETFTRELASFRMPQTNPFLTRTFVRLGGAELDDRVTWVVDDLARILDRTDIQAIQRQFRGETRRDDPVVHFYERFLAEYAPEIRERRGVYYTPGPVVGYIVRSIDTILKRDFGLPRGLADETKVVREQPDGTQAEEHKVQILDPAAGTGTFLFSVLDLLYHDYFKGMEGAWPEYVRDQLLPRLFGFELLMAPYAIAHLKLDLKLRDTLCDLHSGERINLFLTNALEEPHDLSSPPMFTQWLKDEAEAANRVKRDRPVMVVLGNPPYSGESMNPSARDTVVQKDHRYEVYHAGYRRPGYRKAGKETTVKQRTFIGHLLHGWDPVNEQETESYFQLNGAPLGEKNPKWLNDDYVKFIRFAQWRIARTGHGVLGFVTNHGYLDNPTFRGMRESLLRDFDELYLLDLHGSTKKKETAPDGGRDQNVFDIQQGVAVMLCVRHADSAGAGKAEACRVYHMDLWGPRSNKADDPEAETRAAGGKYGWLAANDVATTEWTEIKPQGPQYYLLPFEANLLQEYSNFISLDRFFNNYSAGIISGRDYFVIDLEKEPLKRRITNFVQSNDSEEDLRSCFLRAKDKLDIREAQNTLKHENIEKYIISIKYRPFDNRYVFYHESLIERSRKTFVENMLCCSTNLNRNVMPGNDLGTFYQPLRRERDFGIKSGNDGADNTDLETQNTFPELPTLGISVPRTVEQGNVWNHIFLSDMPTQHHTVSLKEVNYLFPLYFRNNRQASLFQDEHISPNLNRKFLSEIETQAALTLANVPRGDLASTFGPEDVLAYVYAILHTPGYRARYGDYLRRDFPRIPLPPGKALFVALCRIGHRLMALHLLREEAAPQPGFPVPPGDDGNLVEKPRYLPPDEGRAGRVHINQTQYFEGVPEDVWAFHVGGYQVCEKWLKDRKGRLLTYEEIATYRRIVAALSETLTLMTALDTEIENHGGWPLKPAM